MRRALDRARLRVENQLYREKLEATNRELQASLHLLQEDQNAGRQVQMNMLPVTDFTMPMQSPSWEESCSESSDLSLHHPCSD